MLAAVVALLLLAAPTRAGTEEFSTFDVEVQEEDDESLLDHILSRSPRAWEAEWERSPLALRTAQGCLTSGKWINETDLKLRTSLGARSWFGVVLRQNHNDRSRYDYLDLSVHFPTRWGTAGALYRPFADKSLQDFALLWDIGADTSAFQMRAVFALEDVFNNFWEFRQRQVGSSYEPYLRRPWEPGLRLVVRQPRLRAELGGRYLTPATKHIVVSFVTPDFDRITTLWGTLAWASLEAQVLGVAWELRTTNQQASSTDRPAATPQPDGRNYRRQWVVEAAARRPLAERLTGEVRWLYQDRTQRHGPPIDPPRFHAVDRMVQLEAVWRAKGSLAFRAGGLYDRIGVVPSGVAASALNGSRTESRAYLGVLARFGRVSLQVVEGFELDHEPYEVSFIHDKGFLQLQMTF